MLRKALDSLDIVDWLMAACIASSTFIAASFTYQFGDIAVVLWEWKGQLLQLGAAGAVGLAGATLLAGFVLRSRVVYVLLIVASVLGVLSFVFSPPALGMLYGLLRERGRVAFFSPGDLKVEEPSPAQAVEEATQVFRARSFEQDQTVLMHGAELAELRHAPEPGPQTAREPGDDPTVPDQIEVVMGWILAAYGLLSACFGGWLLLAACLNGMQGGPEALQSAAGFGVASLPFFLTSAACWSMWRGFYTRARWNWVVGLILGLSMLFYANLPLGAALLFCLLRKRGRLGFGVAGLEQTLGLKAAA